MKKFPRIDVIEKQVAVALDAPLEECTVSKDELGNVTGGQTSSLLSRFGRGLSVMYGVSRPARQLVDSARRWLTGGSSQEPKAE